VCKWFRIKPKYHLDFERIMKTMTCNQLGGACECEFSADSFEEIAELSKQHGMEMFFKNDPAHLEAISNMQALMQTPGAMQEWFEEKRKEFEELPDKTS
jgi:predicted small metal-binding protein|tara:strand:- start:140 stop:436 length:297 start_codon:yes stop_codon:yes gene_type:complete